jgi:hypothetical protein
MKTEQTECSETLALKLQMPVNHPEESIGSFICLGTTGVTTRHETTHAQWQDRGVRDTAVAWNVKSLKKKYSDRSTFNVLRSEKCLTTTS